MESLEERIGYKFRNSLLLAEAMTHPSLAYESNRPHFDNQRLEFLGDAVLQLVLTEEFYLRFPLGKEGALTKTRARLVSRPALHRYAQALSLSDYILLGKGEEASGGRERPSTLSDAFEALVGALYLDGGIQAARSFILRQCRPDIRLAYREPDALNPKGRLQEILQSISQSSPVYEIVASEGPDHRKHFTARALWNGVELGRGCGASKKSAEISAASDALDRSRWAGEKAEDSSRSEQVVSRL